MESLRKIRIFYVPCEGWFGNLAQRFVHGVVPQAPARRASVPMSMAVLLFIGKCLTRRSSGSPPITSSICLLGWWFGARWGTFSPGMVQLSLQLVNLTLKVPVIFCMGNMTLPTRATFGSMSCAHTPLTTFPLFGTPVRITMLGAPWLCLVWVGIFLMWSCCVAIWTYFLHHERLNRISFKLDQTLPTDGANCKNSICNDPKFVLGSNVKGPNNKFVSKELD